MTARFLPRTLPMTSFSCADILAGRAPQDTPVTVKGWVRTRRDSKAGISFVHVSDGSSFHPVQVVAPNTLANYADDVMHLTAGCAVEATGTIVPSPAKGQPFEMQASAIEVIGWVEDSETYPIQPKPHTLEFLREVAHLRPRTNVIGAATRVRHTLAKAIHRFFDENGFFWVNTPIITAADAEGAGALFRVSTLEFANLPRTPEGGVDFAQDFFGREIGGDRRLGIRADGLRRGDPGPGAGEGRKIRVSGELGHRSPVGTRALPDRKAREKADHRDELPKGHQGVLHAG